MSHQKGYIKAPGMAMKLEDDLADNIALMLESDKVTVMG